MAQHELPSVRIDQPPRRGHPRRALAARLAVCLVLLALPGARAIADGPTVVVRSFAADAELAVDATVGPALTSEPGLWLRLEVHAILWGDGVPAGPLWVFTHGPGVSESLVLRSGERAIVGLRRVASDAGAFHQRLLDTLPPEIDPGAAMLGAPDAAIPLDGPPPPGLEDGLRTLVALGRQPRGLAAGDRVRAFGLLESPQAFLRLGALRLLTRSALALDNNERVALRNAFGDAVRTGEQAQVLLGYVDLVRAMEIDGCDDTLCDLLTRTDDTALVEDSLAALGELGDESSALAIVEQLDRRRLSPTARGRLLRALARLEWPGTLERCREAIVTGDAREAELALDAVGEIDSSRAATFLEEIFSIAPSRIRARCIGALARQKNAHSRAALLRLSEEELSPGERRLIRRNLRSLRLEVRKGSRD